MVDLPHGGQSSFLQAHLTQRVRRRIAVPDTLPSSTVFLVDVRAALVPVVLITVQFLVFRAEPLAG